MFLFGSVTSYARQLQLQQKWSLKQQGVETGPSRFSALVNQTANTKTQANAARTQAIREKLKAGQRLTAEEMEYLRRNEPALYQKAKKIQQEREEYRRELERCRTKEEARRVTAAKNAMAAVNARLSGEDPETIQMHSAALRAEQKDFAASPRYRQLRERQAEVQMQRRAEQQRDWEPDGSEASNAPAEQRQDVRQQQTHWLHAQPEALSSAGILHTVPGKAAGDAKNAGEFAAACIPGKKALPPSPAPSISAASARGPRRLSRKA